MNERNLIKKMSIFTDQTRLKLIYVLSLSSFCSIHLEKLLSVSQPNISRHIDKMASIGIVTIKKDGRRNIYSLSEKFKKDNSQIISEIKNLYDDVLDKKEFQRIKKECDQMIGKKL